jgi:pimeloyl-ACP methyl ester carboxylesterase
MGGYTTLAFLRRCPHRVRGLVLIDTKASADTAEAATGRRAMADRLEDEQSAQVLVEQVYPRLLGATTFEQQPAVADQLRLRVAAAPPWSAAWAQRAMAARRDCVDVLRTYSRPTLIVVGEEDVLSPPSDARVMADALASPTAAEVSLSVIPGVGHLTPLEAPGNVASAIAGFARGLG